MGRAFVNNEGRAAGFVVLALLLLLSILGCEASQSPGAATVEAVRPEQSSAAVIQTGDTEPLNRQVKLGFSQLGSESDWRLANTKSIEEAAKEAGIELLFKNAEQSQEKQFEAVRSFIKEGVDVIAIAPVVETGWEPILREVQEAGIPLLILDRKMELTDQSLYVSFIGSDFYEEGRMAGRFLLDKMRDQPGEIRIAELRGTEGASPSIDRGTGFRDAIKERAELTIYASEPADFTQERGKEVMRSFLQSYGDEIDVLFAHNDDMALGAIEAVEEHGLRPGKDIIIISVDGTRQAFEMMVEGKINAVVECNPMLGPNVMQAVLELMEGRTLPKRIITPERIYTEVTAEREVANRKY
ncbi:ABC transporter substrate-binding protein [Paenibacillus nanensis]|uniref:ABC transporter substrate-binding protein n=1 Tax=Paenibacillus nanensis TaxID=393251 RepID=A0A3A1UQD6_9BACL|nr:ABC transporter substrate-binding protein [Paenibacillus nanensis]RIX49996.1 ABC transporter substrate-binding protein [Paenibacillus nanensis]